MTLLIVAMGATRKTHHKTRKTQNRNNINRLNQSKKV